jgi:spore coat polysaccharide biosynthesis protein SpsF
MRVAIIQARYGATRFPGKIFADLSGKPLIWHVVNRLNYCKRIDRILIATTVNSSDDLLEEWARKQGIFIYRGSEDNVLNRYYSAANATGLKDEDIVIRITADDPFKEPALIDRVVETVENGEAVFAYNNKPPTFPEGLDCEVFTMASLEKAEKESEDPYEREHVTQYMYRHPELFKGKNISQEKDLSYLRFTIDTEDDYKMVQEIYAKLYKENTVFLLEDILKLFDKYPYIPDINRNIRRSAMYTTKR